MARSIKIPVQRSNVTFPFMALNPFSLKNDTYGFTLSTLLTPDDSSCQWNTLMEQKD